MFSNCRAYQHVNVYKGGGGQQVMGKKISVWCFISSFRFVCIILFLVPLITISLQARLHHPLDGPRTISCQKQNFIIFKARKYIRMGYKINDFLKTLFQKVVSFFDSDEFTLYFSIHACAIWWKQPCPNVFSPQKLTEWFHTNFFSGVEGQGWFWG